MVSYIGFIPQDFILFFLCMAPSLHTLGLRFFFFLANAQYACKEKRNCWTSCPCSFKQTKERDWKTGMILKNSRLHKVGRGSGEQAEPCKVG